MTLTRRSLLAQAGALLLPGQPPLPDWCDKPMRWAQLVFVEDDPGNYDIGFWLDYFKRTHADAVCLAGGGYMAYYPTQVPLHRRSKWLANGDAFGDLVKECRKLGMVVIARTDPHATHQETFDAHPDWIAVEANGQRRRHWAKPDLWVTCALGPYNFEFMTAVTREIVEKYKIDGVFSNRWAGSGMCYCEHCRDNFHRSTGLQLPRTSDPNDPARRAHILWRQQRLFECARIWDSAIRKANPNACFIPNSGGGALSPLDMKTLGEMCPILFADRQARRGAMSPWANGKNAKEYRAAMGSKPIGGIFSVGLEEPYRWKDSVQTPAELQVWIAEAIAHGMRPWYAKFNAKVIDKRWMQPVAEMYQWHHANERYLRNTAPLADIGIVYSQRTAWFYGGDRAAQKVEDHIDGFYQALVESRVPFEMVHEGFLDEAHLKPFRTLILPNIAAMSDAQCDQIRAFVQRGGSLIATHETSLYNESGDRRPDFGLATLFGCSFAGKVESRMQNSYLSINGPHPLLEGLAGTPRIINGVSRVHCKPHRPTTAPLNLVPSYPDLPMEDVFPRVHRTDDPQVYLNGRVLYFPFDLDRTYWEFLHHDHLKLLRNAVAWASQGRSPLTVEGSGYLDVSLWRQKESVTVHLVNLTNPMAMRGSFREIFPVGKQTVSVTVPSKVSAVRLLVAGRQIPYRMENGVLTCEVPEVRLHEVVAIDLA